MLEKDVLKQGILYAFFLTIFLIFVSGSCFSKPMNSEDFIFSEIFECGEKRETFSLTKPRGTTMRNVSI